MGISICTNGIGIDTDLSRFSVAGASNHVSLVARYTPNKRSKRFTLTLSREEAVELAASILAVLSDGARDETMIRAGKCGDSMLRYPKFTVFSSKVREKHEAGNSLLTMPDPTLNRKPTHYQHLMTTKDGNGNARSLYVLYQLDGNVHSIIEGNYNTPKECGGLFQLDSVNVAPKEYRDWVKVGKGL